MSNAIDERQCKALPSGHARGVKLIGATAHYEPLVQLRTQILLGGEMQICNDWHLL